MRLALSLISLLLPSCTATLLERTQFQTQHLTITKETEMILKSFSIYDTKAEAFLPPFFCPTSGVAIRNFEAAANEQGHAFNKHATDYNLFELGTFDDVTGIITSLKAPISHGLAITMIAVKPASREEENTTNLSLLTP